MAKKRKPKVAQTILQDTLRKYQQITKKLAALMSQSKQMRTDIIQRLEQEAAVESGPYTISLEPRNYQQLTWSEAEKLLSSHEVERLRQAVAAQRRYWLRVSFNPAFDPDRLAREYIAHHKS